MGCISAATETGQCIKQHHRNWRQSNSADSRHQFMAILRKKFLWSTSFVLGGRFSHFDVDTTNLANWMKSPFKVSTGACFSPKYIIISLSPSFLGCPRFEHFYQWYLNRHILFIYIYIQSYSESQRIAALLNPAPCGLSVEDALRLRFFCTSVDEPEVWQCETHWGGIYVRTRSQDNMQWAYYGILAVCWYIFFFVNKHSCLMLNMITLIFAQNCFNVHCSYTHSFVLSWDQFSTGFIMATRMTSKSSRDIGKLPGRCGFAEEVRWGESHSSPKSGLFGKYGWISRVNIIL